MQRSVPFGQCEHPESTIEMKREIADPSSGEVGRRPEVSGRAIAGEAAEGAAGSAGRSGPWYRLPPRYRTLAWVAGLFLAINALVRLGLIAFAADSANLQPLRLLEILAVGLLYDAAALAYVLVPFALLASLVPGGRRGRVVHATLASLLVFAAIVGMLFTAASEGVFWNEFSSRFNFIAVDYLVYTREVVGNVRESYPIGAMLAVIFALGLVVAVAIRRPLWRAGLAAAGTKRQRLAGLSVALALPVLSFGLVGDAPREATGAGSARDLAGNGYYEFMRAYRSNDLDFRAFYRTMDLTRAETVMRDEFTEAGSRDVFTQASSRGVLQGARNPLERTVRAEGATRPMNVVLVSMESLGADYVESFGGRPGLTPNLDRLAREGLMFTQTYATGLRTVRGLEALTLSIPPTPGHAVPMRANNKGFQTIGGVFREHGYDALYLYGGYSYFDNMRDFFGGNGYTVIDRGAIAKEDISHETIWGVADEDLFRLAVREIDSRTAAGRKVFAHVMTTSNHRPFTYPAGRIDIASGTSRDGAVKYSDWAIGEFIREASTRPWFRDTLFVFVADHTSNGRGRTDLPPENYRVPLIIYAPGTIAAGRVEQVASQIDVAPTVLALLNLNYTSRFFGQDILTEGVKHPRALMANYLTVGYMERGVVVELSPKRRTGIVDAVSGKPVATDDPRGEGLVDEAVAYYQVATQVLRGDARTPVGQTARASATEH